MNPPRPTRTGRSRWSTATAIPNWRPRVDAQAERVGARLATEHEAGERIDAIYVTTLRRTHETAAPLVERIAVEPAGVRRPA